MQWEPAIATHIQIVPTLNKNVNQEVTNWSSSEVLSSPTLSSPSQSAHLYSFDLRLQPKLCSFLGSFRVNWSMKYFAVYDIHSAYEHLLLDILKMIVLILSFLIIFPEVNQGM